MPSLNPTTIQDETWRHGNLFVDEAREVRIHYIDCPASQIDEKGVILLIHGFPNTNYQWRHVIKPLSEAGYRVIAPDYRGAGGSSRPKSGYEKLTLANDLYKLVHNDLGEHAISVPLINDKLLTDFPPAGLKSPIHVVGQDIGGMVAHAYAASHPAHTKSVMWGECPLPGSTPYESGFKNSPGMWHFTFQQVLDLPELLTQGREKIYIKHFYDRLCFNPTGITTRDVDVYADSFEQPGSMRAGFELYRAFGQDAKDNRRMLGEGGKLKMPAAALCGNESLLLEVAEEQTREFYENVEVVGVEGSGHWTAEESPGDFVKKVSTFVGKHK